MNTVFTAQIKYKMQLFLNHIILCRNYLLMDPHNFIITVVDRFKGSDSRQNFEIPDFWGRFLEFLIKILTLISWISFSTVSIAIAYIRALTRN